jgi:hypothetical protein
MKFIFKSTVFISATASVNCFPISADSAFSLVGSFRVITPILSEILVTTSGAGALEKLKRRIDDLSEAERNNFIVTI